MADNDREAEKKRILELSFFLWKFVMGKSYFISDILPLGEALFPMRAIAATAAEVWYTQPLAAAVQMRCFRMVDLIAKRIASGTAARVLDRPPLSLPEHATAALRNCCYRGALEDAKHLKKLIPSVQYATGDDYQKNAFFVSCRWDRIDVLRWICKNFDISDINVKAALTWCEPEVRVWLHERFGVLDQPARKRIKKAT